MDYLLRINLHPSFLYIPLAASIYSSNGWRGSGGSRHNKSHTTQCPLRFDFFHNHISIYTPYILRTASSPNIYKHLRIPVVCYAFGCLLSPSPEGNVCRSCLLLTGLGDGMNTSRWKCHFNTEFNINDYPQTAKHQNQTPISKHSKVLQAQYLN